MIYAGIGSRQTPPNIIRIMEAIAKIRAAQGWTLRSGFADGADQAFERGCDSGRGEKEIFLPWKGYNRSSDPKHIVAPPKQVVAANDLASNYHPNWSACNQAARKLHGRNMFVAAGLRLDSPVNEIICWTPNGKITGGTGQVLRFALATGIKTINLADYRNAREIATAVGV